MKLFDSLPSSSISQCVGSSFFDCVQVCAAQSRWFTSERPRVIIGLQMTNEWTKVNVTHNHPLDHHRSYNNDGTINTNGMIIRFMIKMVEMNWWRWLRWCGSCIQLSLSLSPFPFPTLNGDLR